MWFSVHLSICVVAASDHPKYVVASVHLRLASKISPTHLAFCAMGGVGPHVHFWIRDVTGPHVLLSS